MGDAVQMSLPASEVPRTPGQRMRAIDTLLADRGQLFQALFLSAPIPKALVALGGHILAATPMLCALTGRTAEELSGRHVALFAPPDDPPVADLGLLPGPGDPLHLDPHLLLDGERRLGGGPRPRAGGGAVPRVRRAQHTHGPAGRPPAA